MIPLFPVSPMLMFLVDVPRQAPLYCGGVCPVGLSAPLKKFDVPCSTPYCPGIPFFVSPGCPPPFGIRVGWCPLIFLLPALCWPSALPLNVVDSPYFLSPC
jgi:hypothetical protein